MCWLSIPEQNNRYQSARTERFDSVGNLLLETSEPREWRCCQDGSDKVILFCSGDPGVDETYMK